VRSESWEKIWCDHCNVINWVALPKYYGDCSGIDYQGCECYNCGKPTWFIEEGGLTMEDLKMELGDNEEEMIENALLIDGEKTPEG
jgi:hypothetical protein